MSRLYSKRSVRIVLAFFNVRNASSTSISDVLRILNGFLY